MSFITRCPACGTAFKVVPDQLKISDGWVRCGQCQHIFDATLDLQPWWPGQPLTASPPPPPPNPVPDPVSNPPAVLPPSPAAVHTPEPDLVPDVALHSEQPDFEPTLVIEPPLSQVPGDGKDVAPEVEPPPMAAPTPVVHAAPPMADTALRAADPNDPDDRPPSFVRQAQRRARWQRPWVRAVLWLVGLALLGVLAAQMAVHWRSWVAAQTPAAKPALEALCAPVDCVVEPPRQLDDLVIDSSVLVLQSPGRYAFSIVVRNRATVEMVAPALELTLTNAQDQVVARRVIPADQWPEPRTTIAPGAEWSVRFDLELATAQDQVMTGYRALLFYP